MTCPNPLERPRHQPETQPKNTSQQETETTLERTVLHISCQCPDASRVARNTEFQDPYGLLIYRHTHTHSY